MSTVTVFFEGLCLWLTTVSPMPVVAPDFRNAVPEHQAVLTVTDGFDGGCPYPFSAAPDGSCVFKLNGMGMDGGVKIELTGDAPPFKPALCAVPPIQHTVPLTLRNEFSPGGGSRLAAQLAISQGELSAEISDRCKDPKDCPRIVKWVFTPASSEVSLRLLNLRDGTTVTLTLLSGATVTLSNRRVQPPEPPDTDVADWCLYFSMFQDAGCPGKPSPPSCPRIVARDSRVHQHSPPAFETIACSNSQYP